MSHFTTVETQIRDLAALRSACTELGLDLIENTTARGYGGQTRRGDYIIRLRGPYDIALHRRQDGSYGPTTDWWSGHVGKPGTEGKPEEETRDRECVSPNRRCVGGIRVMIRGASRGWRVRRSRAECPDNSGQPDRTRDDAPAPP